MIKKTVLIKQIARILVIAMLAAIYTGSAAFAADEVVLPAPRNYRLTDIGYERNALREDWFAGFEWDPVTFPPEASERYITVGFSEVEYGTGRVIPDVMQITLPGNATTQTINEYTPETIKHGCIYASHARASYTVSTATGQYMAASQKSNSVKFLTGLHVSAELVPGTNYIKISWDDVWDTSGRINYRILISDTGGFTQPPSIPDIVASEIGKPGSPVVVNTAEKKLELTYTYALPGREYAIKVIPLPDSQVAVAPEAEIPPVKIKTDILLQAYRAGYTNDGDIIWKLSWNPIVKGNAYTRVDYELYRYVNNDLNGQLYRLIPDKDSYEIVISKNDTNTYSFKIDAKAYAPGSTVPVEFRSNNRVELKEQIPQKPEAPEITDRFPTAEGGPLDYEELLTAHSATVMWKAPYTGEGLVDNGITYDIYLVDDIRYVQSPPDNYRIASDIRMNETNQIKDSSSGAVIGYRYDLSNLESNATYYFVIYAKKNYLVMSPQDGFMITMPYISHQAVKVIITRPDTGTDRPVAPSSPPFLVKGDPGSVTSTTATLQLDKRWYALYDAAGRRWKYATRDEYLDNQALPDSDPSKQEGMVINYMPGWKIVPHAVRFNDAMTVIQQSNSNRPGEYIAYSDLTRQDILAFEIPQYSVTVPDIPEDAENQTFDINITGLTHNTAYVVWVTVENQNGNRSDPSDPLIITTPPDIPQIPITPTVPTDLRGIAAANFIDLFWTYAPGMRYEIRCGNEDNLENASIREQVTYEEMLAASYFRLVNLQPDTQYYIWIKAINEDTGIESEFSNPLLIKTEAYSPPPPPSGFGVKAGADGVTEHSITYVWESLTGYSYQLEFADNIDFNGAQIFEVTGDSHTVSSLISNRRYYARLYAYDNQTGLRSVPTRTIMVTTNKSRDEYDSGFDLEDAPTGDILVISPKVVDGVWTVSATGVNAHRMAEQLRSIQDFIVKIDLSRPPAKAQTVRLELGAVLIDTLSELKKELYIKLPSNEILIRPQTLQTDEYFKLKKADGNFTLRLEAVSPATRFTLPSNLSLVAPVTEFRIGPAATGRSFSSLVRPIRVDFPVQNLSRYMAGEIGTYLYDDRSKSWVGQETGTDYAGGRVLGEMTKPGAMAAATRNVAPAGAVPQDVTNSLKAIQAVYRLKSLEAKTFRHTDPVRLAEVVKLLLDLTGTVYDDGNFLTQAARSGIIASAQEITDGYARKDQAIGLLVSYYRFRTRLPASPENPSAWSHYQDLNKVSAGTLNAVKFAVENGVVTGNGTNYLNPDKTVTYGELIIMLERVLRICGDL